MSMKGCAYKTLKMKSAIWKYRGQRQRTGDQLATQINGQRATRRPRGRGTTDVRIIENLQKQVSDVLKRSKAVGYSAEIKIVLDRQQRSRTSWSRWRRRNRSHNMSCKFVRCGSFGMRSGEKGSLRKRRMTSYAVAENGLNSHRK